MNFSTIQIFREVLIKLYVNSQNHREFGSAWSLPGWNLDEVGWNLHQLLQSMFQVIQAVTLLPPNVGGWSLILGSRHLSIFSIPPKKGQQSQNCQGVLGGGFKYFLFSLLFEEDFQFDYFFFRWVETTNQSRWFHDFHLGKQLGISARHRAIYASSSPVRCGFGHYRWWIFDLYWCRVDSCGFTKHGPKSREWISNHGITHGLLMVMIWVVMIMNHTYHDGDISFPWGSPS